MHTKNPNKKGEGKQRKRLTESQIIKVLKHVEAGRKVADVCREYAIIKGVIVTRKAKCGDMEATGNLE